ncbi:hypothetical protein GCM10023093_04490 [Nemorincola caseinilytica]|uniref:Polysaccharide biosynthesis protein C-terminal domain-containing protein n=1 Tax=Nemorincola caseinilytica TaxID=2054315 RepID=A0ABP8N3W1_9BACT
MPLRRANNIFLSNSFFIFIARFFPMLANLLVTIWYSRHLPQHTFGNYQYFWIQLNIMYPLLCFGIHALIITYSKTMLANILSRIRRGYYLLFLLWMLSLSAVFAYMQYDAGSVPFLISFLFILSFAVNTIIESVLIVFRRYNVLMVTGLLYALAYCAIHRYALGNGFSIRAIFSMLLIAGLLRTFVHCLAVIKEVQKDTDGYEVEDVDVPGVRSLWLHLGIYDISQMLFSWIDKFVISLVLSASLSAIYYNGAQNIPFLPMLLSAAGSAVLLQLAGNMQQYGETRHTILLVNQMGRVLSCIVFPVFCFLYFFRNELIVNLLSEKYIPAIPIFAISVLALPVKAYSFTSVLQRMHKGGIINAGALADLVLACALMYPLYLWLGLPGVALSFVISTYLQAAFYLYYTGRLLGISPLRLIPLGNWLAKLIVFATVFIAIHYIGSIYFTGRFTLILGAIAVMVTAAISLGIELYWHRRHGAASKTKFKEYR